MPIHPSFQHHPHLLNIFFFRMESFERGANSNNFSIYHFRLDSDIKYRLFAIFSLRCRSISVEKLWRVSNVEQGQRRSSPERKWLSVPGGRERNGASRLFARWQSIPIAPRFLPRSDSLQSIRRIGRGRCCRIHRITFIYVNYRLVIRIETRGTVSNS